MTRYLTALAAALLLCAPAFGQVTAEVALEWGPPADGGPVDVYEARCDGPSGTIIDVVTPDTSHTETVALADGEYVCTLVAVGDDGRAGEAVMASFVVNPRPGTPTNFRVTVSFGVGG